MKKLTSISLWLLITTAAPASISAQESKMTILAIRSNVIFPMMNAGVEIPLGNRISLSADLYSPWIRREWVNNFAPANKYCVEALGGYADLRYWLGHTHKKGSDNAKYRLCGHSLGLVGGYGIFDWSWNNHELSDSETGENTPWSGRQGQYWCAGLSYMYSVPLGRKGWGRMEFELAAGYYDTTYTPYSVYMEGGHLFSDGYRIRKRGFMPLKAGVNFVLTLFSNKIGQ